MANITKTNMDAIGFIPEIWGNEVLRVLRANSDIIRAIARDTDFNAPQSPGDVINISYPGTFSVQSKADDTPISPAAPSGGTKISVALNKFKTVDYLVEDLAAAQSNQNLLQRYTEPAANALNEAIVSDIHALYTGFSQSVGTSGTDLSAATIRAAAKTLDDAKIPRSGRSIFMSSKDFYALLADSNLQTYFAFARSDAIREGRVPDLYGFACYLSQLTPVVSGTPNSTKNLALHRDAAILAFRPFRTIPDNAGVQTYQIMDPETGVILRVLVQYDMSNRGLRVAFDVLYGVAELRDSAGVVVLS